MKHVCKPKYHHLKIVNMPFPKRKHGTYEAQTRQLRRVNTALTMSDVNNKLCESSFNPKRSNDRFGLNEKLLYYPRKS